MTSQIFSIDDARRIARQRLPRLMFDFIDGAAGNERAKGRNREALEALCLMPRVLVNVDQRSLSKRFLDRQWDYPFGIAPMGMCDLAWPNTDKHLATAAAKYNIPLSLSTMASSTIEEVYEWSEGNAWFQLYVGQSEELAMELVARAEKVGYSALILTVDVPQVAPRLRDLRNGFSLPFRIGPRQFWDFATHPRWSLQTLFTRVPSLANVPTVGSQEKSFNRNAGRGLVDWNFLDRIRDRWPRKLIVKGVLSPDDAKRIQTAGADAIYVSNHGGRQLASAPPPIQMLPIIREAVGAEYPLLFDSGIRSGESVVKALALGADFVMLGRPFLYGSGAAGGEGVNAVTELLANEVSVTLAQLGQTDIEEIDRSIIIES